MKSGLTIRMAIEDLRVMGRATQVWNWLTWKGKILLQLRRVMKDDVERSCCRWRNVVVEVVAIEESETCLEVLEDENWWEDEDDNDRNERC
jgi:DNA gyrase subunit A